MIIGLIGEMGAGKSTMATYLTQEWKFREYAFAEPLKRMIIELFGIEEKYVYDPAWKEKTIPSWNVSGRTLMQRIGTDIMRETLPAVIPELQLNDTESIWIKRARQAICQAYKDGVHMAFSDVRFENEAKFIQEQGGILIEITRPKKNVNDPVKNKHKSETEQKKIKPNYCLTNDGTVVDFHQKIFDLLTCHIGMN